MTPVPCAHLRPLLEHLHSLGLEVAPCASPYGETPFSWWSMPCVFTDVPGLRRRLGLDASLEYSADFDFAAGADAKWLCREHHVVLIGPHPGTAGKDVPRVGGDEPLKHR